MALIQVFIPSGKIVHILCFLVLAFSHTGHFFGDECPAESSLLCGIPPLDCQQVQQVRDAIADGTVDNIRRALEADGPIFVGNSSFPPIVNLTEAQMCGIERCFGSFDPIPSEDSNRRKRGVEDSDLACEGNVGAVQYTVQDDGSCAQVVVGNLPSTTGCVKSQPTSRCSGCCCTRTFMVRAVGITLCSNSGSFPGDFYIGDFEIEHCTCCNS